MKNSVNFNIVRRLFTALCLVLVAAGASAQFSGSGSGTKDDPYRIYNAAQLNQVRNFLNNANVVFSLVADIDMSDWIADNNHVQGLSPIGNSDNNAFCGTFNGNGHTISNLWIKRPDTDYIGLFGCAGISSEIHDLTLTDARYEGKNYVGGFIGGIQYIRNVGYTNGSISNCCFLRGKIKSSNRTGGIIGNLYMVYIYNYNVTNCNSECQIIANKYCGGIIGYACIDLYNLSEAPPKDKLLFLIDSNLSKNCIIEGLDYIGGIIGYIETRLSMWGLAGGGWN